MLKLKSYILSAKKLNWNLYLALLVMGLVPTIYTSVRVFFIGQLDNTYAYSIAGQLSWVNLLFEVIDEAIILPLFFFMGRAVHDKSEFSNRLKTGLLCSFGIYAMLASVINIFTPQLFSLMAVTPDIMEESISYIRIESIANIFGILYRYAFVALVTIGFSKAVYALTGIKAGLSIALDTILISTLSISFHLGVNGIGYSNIISNVILLLITLAILRKLGYWNGEKTLSLGWMSDFFKIGGISGAESFVRNFAYMVMISRMVNMVGEQGIFWMANNFIWCWLLLPILQLGELIKQEVSTDENAMNENMKGYVFVTSIVCLLWLLCIPIYKPFIGTVLGYPDVDKLFCLIMIMLIPYIFFAFQNICDAVFYGKGKTEYLLLEALTTNIIYYGGAYLTYMNGLWTPSLHGIALLFGIGNIFDSSVTWILFRRYKKSINCYTQ